MGPNQPRRCLVCSEDFQDWYAASRHAREEHPDFVDGVLVDEVLVYVGASLPPGGPDGGPFDCPECRVRFASQSALMFHLQKEHDISWDTFRFRNEMKALRFSRSLRIIRGVTDFLVACKPSVFTSPPQEHH